MRFIVLICIAFLPLLGEAWSGRIHILISEKGLDSLPRSEKTRLNQSAHSLLKNVKQFDAEYYRGRYRWAGYFAYLSAWLDSQRGEPLEDLFKRLGTSLPKALHSSRRETTGSWHYSNSWHYASSSNPRRGQGACKLKKSGKLREKLKILKHALAEGSLDSKQHTLVLAFYFHLLADAHQPLHTVSRVGPKCRHDRGGNLFCIKGRKKCRLNLHQYWDRGAYVFRNKSKNKIFRLIDGVDMRGSDGAVESTIKNSAVIDKKLIEFIYSLKARRKPGKKYEYRAQKISLQKVALAAKSIAVEAKALKH